MANITEMCCWPEICLISDSTQIISHQQDGALSHRIKESVVLLKTAIPDFIPPTLWPPNSPDINLVDYKIWGTLVTDGHSNGSTEHRSGMLMSCAITLQMNGISWGRTSLTRQLDSGDKDFGLVSLQWRTFWAQTVKRYILLIFLIG